VKNKNGDLLAALVPDQSPFEAEIATAELKKERKTKSPDSDQSYVKRIQAGSGRLWSKTQKLIYRATKLTLVIIVRYHCYQHHIQFYPTSLYQG
jgi:hypothetical protein